MTMGTRPVNGGAENRRKSRPCNAWYILHPDHFLCRIPSCTNIRCLEAIYVQSPRDPKRSPSWRYARSKVVPTRLLARPFQTLVGRLRTRRWLAGGPLRHPVSNPTSRRSQSLPTALLPVDSRFRGNDREALLPYALARARIQSPSNGSGITPPMGRTDLRDVMALDKGLDALDLSHL
jgi:hypothetical protein